MSSVKLLKLRDYLTIREATDYLAGITGTRYSRVEGQILALVNEKKLFLYKNETPSYDYRGKVMYTLAQIANGKVPEGDVYHIKRKEIDALLESLHAKSTSQTDQTELEKQMQEKINVLSAKIAQLESENLELKEENKELKTLAKEPTKSVYTLTGALLKLLVDHRKPKRNQTSIVTELVDLAKAENIEGLSKPNIDKFFIVAKKHLEDATGKG